MPDEIIQIGPSSFIGKFTFDPEVQHSNGYVPEGKYYCEDCTIYTDGIPDSKEDLIRHCPICSALFN
jgi:hypothetical protein